MKYVGKLNRKLSASLIGSVGEVWGDPDIKDGFFACTFRDYGASVDIEEPVCEKYNLEMLLSVVDLYMGDYLPFLFAVIPVSNGKFDKRRAVQVYEGGCDGEGIS